MNKRKENILSAVILIAGLLISGVIMAQVPSDISYPIPELGNCESQSACKIYCDDSSHVEKCINFALEQGIMSEEEANQAQTMTRAMEQGGPGGCISETECNAYCDNNTHMAECLAFAEKYELIASEELQEMKNMLKAVQEGVGFPGNCSNKQECEMYCDVLEHSEECITFAEASGMMPPEEAVKARKIIPLMLNGESPGGCRSKLECEVYCDNEEHLEECIAFAKKTGMMNEREAEMMEKTKGEGPGNCGSIKECDAYCNNPEHQQECFLFAREHGLMPEEQIRNIEETTGQLRAGIEEASPEAVKCIQNKLGEDIFAKIKAGTYIPGPQIGEKVGDCLEQYREEIQGKLQQDLQLMPTEVTKCLEEQLGTETLNQIKSGGGLTPEIGDVINKCFSQMKTEMVQPQEINIEEQMEQLRTAINEAPPEVITCLENIAPDIIQKIKSGEFIPGPVIGDKIVRCFEEFIPQQQPDDSSFAPLKSIKGKIKDIMGIPSPENLLEGEKGLPNKVRTDDDQLFEGFPPSSLQEMPLPPKEQILPPPSSLQEMPLPPKEQILPPPSSLQKEMPLPEKKIIPPPPIEEKTLPEG